MYIDGGYRRRVEFPEQRRYIIERIYAERDTEHCVEGNQNGDAVVQDILSELRLRGRSLRSIRVTDPKTARAVPWINTAEQGRLYLIRGPWNEEFIDEACSFPLGTHDDQIDAVSLAVQMLEKRKFAAFSF
jgi:predicted phage terminase large subunit-like protein